MDWGHSVTGSARGEGRGAKETIGQVDQIEYLLFQSTQGLHFIFDHSDVAAVLRQDGTGPLDDEPLDVKHMDKVQSLLTKLLDRKTMSEKRSYIETLTKVDYELLVRAYFQLVDKTILAHSTLRH